MDSSSEISAFFGDLNTPLLSDQMSMTLPEVEYLKFKKEDFCTAINLRFKFFLLTANAKLEQDFQKHCESFGITQDFSPEELDSMNIIASLWENMQKVQFSKEVQFQTEQFNSQKPKSGFFFTIDQANLLMKILDTAETFLATQNENSDQSFEEDSI